MKQLRYQIMTEFNLGTAAAPQNHRSFNTKVVIADESTLEATLTVAKAEAYQGEVIVEDAPNAPAPVPSDSERLDALEAAMLAMMGGMSNV